MVRPRSARAHDSVLNAALQLFSERGIDATSMDAIAETSGVSKATIYKHWPDKQALCLEVLSHLHGADSVARRADSGDLRSDLMAVLSHPPSERYADVKARLLPHLMAYAARTPAFAKAWQSRFVEPPRIEIRAVLERGMARGQLPATLNVDLALALLLGPLLYSTMLQRIGHETSSGLLAQVVDAFIDLYARPRRDTDLYARPRRDTDLHPRAERDTNLYPPAGRGARAPQPAAQPRTSHTTPRPRRKRS